MGVEFEVKFRATPEILRTLRAQLPGEEKVISMETTYYDTVGGDLAGKHFTLRQRLENDVSICTLKTPAGPGRNEFETAAPSIEVAIPTLCKLSGENIPTDVTPICGAAFTRVAKTLPFPGGVAEIALDMGVLTGGNRTVPLCEVELELKNGDPAALFAYATGFAADHGLMPERYSKFRRALALFRGEQL